MSQAPTRAGTPPPAQPSLWEAIAHGVPPWEALAPGVAPGAFPDFELPASLSLPAVYAADTKGGSSLGGGRAMLPSAEPGLEPPARRAQASVAEAPSRPRIPEAPSGGRAVCRARYAAVDLQGTGLIDQGVDSMGTRLLLAHNRRDGVSLACGDSLRFRGTPASVRVLWTTRHRYYGPGHRVTTLVLGVSNADWASLDARTKATTLRARPNSRAQTRGI